jgi:hypothetical protein
MEPFVNDSILLEKPSHCSLFIVGFTVNFAVLNKLISTFHTRDIALSPFWFLVCSNVLGSLLLYVYA